MSEMGRLLFIMGRKCSVWAINSTTWAINIHYGPRTRTHAPKALDECYAWAMQVPDYVDFKLISEVYDFDPANFLR